MNPMVALAGVVGLIAVGTCALYFGARFGRAWPNADALDTEADTAIGSFRTEAPRVVELAADLHALGVPVLLEPKEALDDDTFDRPYPKQAAVVLRI